MASYLESIIINLEELMQYIGSHSQLQSLWCHAREYLPQLTLHPTCQANHFANCRALHSLMNSLHRVVN